MFSLGRFLVRCPGGCPRSGLIGAPLINTGVSTSARQQDGTATATGRDPTPLPTSTVGARRVDYVADGHGFRATVKTNEPGTAASAPAAALINSPYAGPVAPVVNHVAPAAIAAPMALAAPLAYGGIVGGGVIGHGAALGLGYGAGILGAGIGKSSDLRKNS
ncbi:adult-specific rigid cuticular protein 15.7 [Caerostris extrusa]|uniref:Adult-specific rigid cuticular protein 15.7 n=1 Tax=Caerostris extrusa TaxID=172846 RepID=A0AAV4TSY1_CAEEX|nr:adult-specific rigid cuticular protein 15.7 [Caerostris extrusa]